MSRFILLLFATFPLFLFAQELNTDTMYYYICVSPNVTATDNSGPEVDSVRFFYSRSGDTLRYWTVTAQQQLKGKEYRKAKKDPLFGYTLQEGIKLNNGKKIIYKLEQSSFIIKGDSLYRLGRIYTLNEDSVKKLWRKQESPATDSKGKQQVDKIVQQNTKQGFMFMFSPDLFKDGIPEHQLGSSKDRCGQTVLLKNYWVVKGKGYYEIRTINRCGKMRTTHEYIISQDMEFLKFGEFYNAKAALLTEENNRYSLIVKP